MTMVVTSTPLSSLHHTIPRDVYSTTCCKLSSPSLRILLRQIHQKTPCKAPQPNGNGVLSIRSYMEDSNSISGFANRVIGALPVIGLLVRIFSDEGGVGSDLVDFAEFRRRVGKNSSMNDSIAFFEFRDRRGRAGDPLYVLLCCWVAAVGAGLLKSEEILEGVARLRISNDVEFEEQNFMALMNEANERRKKLKVAKPSIPVEARVEKALEGIYICCFRKDPIEDEDERLLCIMLAVIFPSVEQPEIQRIVRDKKRKVEEGSDDNDLLDPKPLSRESVQQQMKDLQFLRQDKEA